MNSKRNIAKEYQRSLIDAYYDFRMRKMLEPLYEAFQLWKQGKLPHDDLTELIHKVHRENQENYTFFMQSRDFLITCIKMDTEWFSEWSQANPPPPGVES